jgi:DNA-binding transcriptional regulator YiaG
MPDNKTQQAPRAFEISEDFLLGDREGALRAVRRIDSNRRNDSPILKSCFSLAEDIARHYETDRKPIGFVVGNSVAWEVAEELLDRHRNHVDRAEDTEDWKPLQGSKIVNSYGSGGPLSPVQRDSFGEQLLLVLEMIPDDKHFEGGHAPTRIFERAKGFIKEHLGSADELVGQIASTAVYLAARDLDSQIGDMDRDWKRSLLGCFEEVDHRHEDGAVIEEDYRLKDTYVTKAFELISSSAAEALVERLEAEEGGLAPHRIEWLWGLHEHEDAPYPSPSPNPAGPRLMPVPGGPLSYNNMKGIIQSGGGDWKEDRLGRPVYEYTLEGGDSPWGGGVQLSIEDAIEIDVGRNLLRSSEGADAVALHLLFLAYARNQSPENRPSGQFRIPYSMVSKILGLPDSWSSKTEIKHIAEQIKYLNSLQIQLKRVTYDGKKKKTDAISPARLWDTYLRGVEVSEVPSDTSDVDFWIEGREGAWADLFLHGDHDWRPRAYLPIDVLENVDRRNSYTRPILFHLLFLFRMGEKGEVTVKGSTLLEWCQIDRDWLNKHQESRRRDAILSALDDLKENGFEIDDSRLRTSGIGFEKGWGNQNVYVSPLDDIARASEYIEKKGLPERRGRVWTGKRIRKLRKHLGLSQGDFGEKLPSREGGIGVNQSRVSHMESGTSSPTPRQEEALDELAQDEGFEG